MATKNFGIMRESTLMQLPEEDFKEWIDLFYNISDKKAIWGVHVLTYCV